MKYPNKLREYRKKAHISQSKLAEDIGISDSALQNYEYGERDLPGKVIIKLCEYFNISSDELLGLYTYHVVSVDENDTLSLAQVPLFENLTPSFGDEQPLSSDTYFIPKPIHDSHPQSFLVKVKSECMNLRVPHGSFALVDPESEVETGKVYSVCVGQDDAVLRRIQKLSNGYKLVPESTDPTYEEGLYNFNEPNCDTVTILGEVVWYTIPYGHKI